MKRCWVMGKVLVVLTLLLAPLPGAGGEAAQWGARQFTEFQPGELPLVIAAPHGGQEKPADLPDRTLGVRDQDAHTQELARLIAEQVTAATGRRPHLVICRLHRAKLDANRDLAEAAEGNVVAGRAWREYHGFIEQACAAAVKQFGVAFLIDLHGHGHPDPRVELGYLHDAIELGDCDEALDEATYVRRSSLRWMVEQRGLRHSELLRGPLSLGALLEAQGFPATPSPGRPVPYLPFFRGGYTIARHCNPVKQVTGVQIEANRPRLRDTPENRQRFAAALTHALAAYFPPHLGLRLDGERALPERTANTAER